MPKDGKNTEDQDLWRRVTATVKPYARKNAAAAAPKPAPARPVPRTEPAPPPHKNIPPARTPGPLDDETARKIRRGAMPVEATIDLHGLTEAKAHAALARFIRSARSAGVRTVRVITGTGAGRAGSGVLRRLVPLWLSTPELAPDVLGFGPAGPKDGGAGALYVRLRKR